MLRSCLRLTRRDAFPKFALYAIPFHSRLASSYALADRPKSSSDEIERTIIEGNRLYQKEALEEDPEAFSRLALQQKPDILWIGCADSRVPETTVLRRRPGEIFVHRNIGNVVLKDDQSAQAVIEFAVEHLKVRHIIVVGHTGCGGCIAALGDDDLGTTLNSWLNPIRMLRREQQSAIDAIPSKDEKAAKLAELNVLRSLENIRDNHAVQKAIETRGLDLLGAIYQLSDGAFKFVHDKGEKGCA